MRARICIKVIGLLCESTSMSFTNRTTGVAGQTAGDPLENVGRAASDYHAKAFFNLPCRSNCQLMTAVPYVLSGIASSERIWQ